MPGFDVEVVGTDPSVDRRLAAVAEVRPSRAARSACRRCRRSSRRSPRAATTCVHLCAPGPAGVAAALVGRVHGPAGRRRLPRRAGRLRRRCAPATRAVGWRQAASARSTAGATAVLSPREAADASLGALGVAAGRVGRWDRGVDVARFGPDTATPGLDGRVNVLYAGRLTQEKGADLLAEAFLAAREREPRLHLVLAGGGPEEARCARGWATHATFLGWLDGDALARAYASADLFLFCSRTDTFGQVVLEAQASGLPVVAVAAGGPASSSRTAARACCARRAEALGGARRGLAAATRRPRPTRPRRSRPCVSAPGRPRSPAGAGWPARSATRRHRTLRSAR